MTTDHSPRPHVALLVSVLAVLLLAACTSSESGGDERGPSAPSSGPTATPQGSGATAEWTEASLPEDVTSTGERIEITDTFPGTGRRDALAVGRTAEAGEAPIATVWRIDERGLRKGVPLDVDGDSTSATAVAEEGGTTYVAGSVWTDGTNSSFLQTSTDRRSWNPVDLPEQLTERGALVAALTVSGKDVLALAIDAEDVPVSVDTGTGEIVDLPAPKNGGELGGIWSTARQDTVVALVGRFAPSGDPSVVTYLSTDGGANWRVAGPLPGRAPVLSGLIAVNDGYLATGSLVAGQDRTPAAWFSADGRSWRAEPVPPPPAHRPGWDSGLGAPVVRDGVTFAAGIDEEQIATAIMRRDQRGRWAPFGQTSQWITPGPSTTMTTASGGLQAVQNWNGRTRVQPIAADGEPVGRGGTSGAPMLVEYWESSGLDGDAPLLVGGRTEVVTEPDGAWNRFAELTRLRLEDGSLSTVPPDPRGSAGASGITVRSDDEGNSVLLASRYSPSQDPAVTDEADVVGWFRPAGTRKWRSATGLSGPRTEFLADLAWHDGEWVALGVDRGSSVRSDHSFAAVWTSRNGRTWRRVQGPFDVEPDRDSSLQSSCLLPGGDLVAVGVVGSPDRGSDPLAMRRTDGTWRRMDLSGLGEGADRVFGCAATGDATLFQGVSAGLNQVWKTEDGSSFTPVDVGGEDDAVGTIIDTPFGFAAPGTLGEGARYQAVAWLSRDGLEWTSAAVPVTAPESGSSVLAWGDRLVVSTSGSFTAGVHVLDNPAELLAD